MTQKKSIIKKVQDFFLHDLWTSDTKKKSFTYRVVLRPLRIFFITLKGFFEDKVQIRASALTYNSMLSIVPVIAMIFGIAKGFGMQKMLEKELMSYFENQQQVLQLILTSVRRMLDRVQGGIVAGVGVAMLIWSVMKILSSIENAFNDIWKVKKARSWQRKFSDYLSIMLVAPVLVLASSSITVFLTTNVKTILAHMHLPAFVESITHIGLDLIPYALIWALFSFIYVAFPNTKVKISSAIIAGIVAGTAFQLLQWGYFKFQIKLSNYSAIYGSLAALPLFMIWMQISWIIVLFGAEMSYAVQNVEDFDHNADNIKISTRQKNLLSLLIMHKAVHNFAEARKPMTAAGFSADQNIPVRIATHVIYELQLAGLLTEIVTTEQENAYQPAMDIGLITVCEVLERMNRVNETSPLETSPDDMQKLGTILFSLEENMNRQSSNKLLKDI